MTLPKPAEQMVPSPMVTQTCSHTMVTQVTWGASIRLLEMIVEGNLPKYYLGLCRTLGATSLRGLQRTNFLLHIPRLLPHHLENTSCSKLESPGLRVPRHLILFGLWPLASAA